MPQVPRKTLLLQKMTKHLHRKMKLRTWALANAVESLRALPEKLVRLLRLPETQVSPSLHVSLPVIPWTHPRKMTQKMSVKQSQMTLGRLIKGTTGPQNRLPVAMPATMPLLLAARHLLRRHRNRVRVPLRVLRRHLLPRRKRTKQRSKLRMATAR